jgi:hypothetical protein
VFCSGAGGIKKIQAGDTVCLNHQTRTVTHVREYLTFGGAVHAEKIHLRCGSSRANGIVNRLLERFDAMGVYWCGVIVLELALDHSTTDNGST